eukprot:5665559-Amphidinium_carterae.1
MFLIAHPTISTPHREIVAGAARAGVLRRCQNRSGKEWMQVKGRLEVLAKPRDTRYVVFLL